MCGLPIINNMLSVAPEFCKLMGTEVGFSGIKLSKETTDLVGRKFFHWGTNPDLISFPND